MLAVEDETLPHDGEKDDIWPLEAAVNASSRLGYLSIDGDMCTYGFELDVKQKSRWLKEGDSVMLYLQTSPSMCAAVTEAVAAMAMTADAFDDIDPASLREVRDLANDNLRRSRQALADARTLKAREDALVDDFLQRKNVPAEEREKAGQIITASLSSVEEGGGGGFFYSATAFWADRRDDSRYNEPGSATLRIHLPTNAAPEVAPVQTYSVVGGTCVVAAECFQNLRLQKDDIQVHGPPYTPGVGKPTPLNLFEMMNSLVSATEETGDSIENILEPLLNTINRGALKITSETPLSEIEAEEILFSRFLVAFGMHCRQLGVFGKETEGQKERTVIFDRILIRVANAWNTAKSACELRRSQHEDYSAAEVNSLGFQSALCDSAPGSKDGRPEMYEELLAYTFKKNLRRSGNTVYQQQTTTLRKWCTPDGMPCSAYLEFDHVGLACSGQHMYGVEPADRWCLAYTRLKVILQKVESQQNIEQRRIATLKAQITDAIARGKATNECAKLWAGLWKAYAADERANGRHTVQFEFKQQAPGVSAADACADDDDGGDDRVWAAGDPAELIYEHVSNIWRANPEHLEKYDYVLAVKKAVCETPASAGAGSGVSASSSSSFPALAERFRTAVTNYSSVITLAEAERRVPVRHVMFEISAVVGSCTKDKEGQTGGVSKSVRNCMRTIAGLQDLCDALYSVRHGGGEPESEGEGEHGGVSTAAAVEWHSAAEMVATVCEHADRLRDEPVSEQAEALIRCFRRYVLAVTAIMEDIYIQALEYDCMWWIARDDTVEWSVVLAWSLWWAPSKSDTKPQRSEKTRDVAASRRHLSKTLQRIRLAGRSESMSALICNQVCRMLSPKPKTREEQEQQSTVSCEKPVWASTGGGGRLTQITEVGCKTWVPCMENGFPMTIEHLVMEIKDQRIGKNTSGWKMFVDNFTTNCSNCVAYMSKTRDPAFAVHIPNPYVFSFNNGTYNIETNEFVAYGEEYEGSERPANDSGLNYIPQYFDPLLTVMPIEGIEVPGYDSIIETQHYNERDVEGGSKKFWLDAFIGRLFFRLGDKDDWQKVFVIKGQGATGKSTIAKAVMKCVGERNVGVIPSNCEAQWALATIHNKTVWMCTELKANFKLDMACMQNMISGDPVTVHAKFKDAFDIGSWPTHGMMVGNEIPTAWLADVGGALLRRAAMFEFANTPSSGQAKPDVQRALMQNLPPFLARTTRTYLQASSAQKVLRLPPAMQHFQSTFAKITSPFAQFLQDHVKYTLHDESVDYSGNAVLSIVQALDLRTEPRKAVASCDDILAISRRWTIKDKIEDCALTRETLKRLVAWRSRNMGKTCAPDEGSVPFAEIMADYRQWRDSKKPRVIPDLDKGTVESMCRELGILYKNDKLYGIVDF